MTDEVFWQLNLMVLQQAVTATVILLGAYYGIKGLFSGFESLSQSARRATRLSAPAVVGFSRSAAKTEREPVLH
jgi:hypothetical protein